MTKYNARKTVINGIQFDSKAEGQYYIILKDKQRRGEIESFTLQPKFLLQEGFEKNGKKYRPITYKADFEIVHNDGSLEIVDVKGFVTKEFAIKLKMFEKAYPDLSLTIVGGKHGKS